MTGAERFCSHCAVILAACAVSVQFLKSVAMVRLKSAGLTAASDRRRVRGEDEGTACPRLHAVGAFPTCAAPVACGALGLRRLQDLA